jgi:hypothetical protein
VSRSVEVEEQDGTPDVEAPPLAVRVVGGGEPTAEQLAAVLVALTPTGGGDDGHVRTAAWTRAAMIEGVGGRPATSPADLDVSVRRG